MTDELYTSSLGGLDGADAKCQSRAAAAGLTGVFKAWLSSETISAASRLTHATDGYVLVDGTVVARDWSELTSSNLSHAIDRTERGTAPRTGNAACGAWATVWTGTDSRGQIMRNATCAGWSGTATTGNGATGNAEEKTSWWTQECSVGSVGYGATYTAALYCFEQ